MEYLQFGGQSYQRMRRNSAYRKKTGRFKRNLSPLAGSALPASILLKGIWIEISE